MKKVFSVLLEVTADGAEGCMMPLAVTMCSCKKSQMHGRIVKYIAAIIIISDVCAVS